jgi:hypothetical protein
MCIPLTQTSAKSDNKCGMHRWKLIFVPTKKHELHCADFHVIHNPPIYCYTHLRILNFRQNRNYRTYKQNLIYAS